MQRGGPSHLSHSLARNAATSRVGCGPGSRRRRASFSAPKKRAPRHSFAGLPLGWGAVFGCDRARRGSGRTGSGLGMPRRTAGIGSAASAPRASAAIHPGQLRRPIGPVASTTHLAARVPRRPHAYAEKEREKKKKQKASSCTICTIYLHTQSTYCTHYIHTTYVHIHTPRALPTVRMLHVSQRQLPATGCRWPRAGCLSRRLPVPLRLRMTSAAESRGSGEGPARWQGDGGSAASGQTLRSWEGGAPRNKTSPTSPAPLPPRGRHLCAARCFLEAPRATRLDELATIGCRASQMDFGRSETTSDVHSSA